MPQRGLHVNFKHSDMMSQFSHSVMIKTGPNKKTTKAYQLYVLEESITVQENSLSADLGIFQSTF